MQKILLTIGKAIAAFLARESQVPPFPFDDSEAAPEWQQARRDAQGQEAINRQVDQWQRATSRPAGVKKS